MRTINNSGCRLPAEWEHHDAILIAWPHPDTDWEYMLDEVIACYVDIVMTIVPYERLIILAADPQAVRESLPERVIDHITIVPYTTNDTWARDFGPITMLRGDKPVALDFCFNGWGMKFAADRDNMATRTLADAGVIAPILENRLGFVLEGGGIESDGCGTILTTASCIYSANRNGGLDPDQVDEALRRHLNADRLVVLHSGSITGDDTDGHIDTLARFVAPGTVMYVAPPDDTTDLDYQGLADMGRELAESGFTLIPLPYAGPVYDPADGSRLPATYANFLITPKAVFVPTYGLDTDNEALDTVRSVYPEREVIGIDCRALIRQHGSLHCATMQLIM